MSWRRIALSWALLAALMLGASPRPAGAHAVLLASEPADAARLEQPPGQVVLRFSEPVVPIDLRILAPDGSAVSLAEPSVTNDELVLRLPADLADGTYLVSYRVTSADSHPVAGSIAFTVGSLPGAHAAAKPPPAHDAFWRMTTLGVRTLLYAVLLLTAGLGLCLALLHVPPAVAMRVSRPVPALAAAGIGLAVAFAGVGGGALLGGLPTVLLSPRPWALVLGTPIAETVAAAICGLLLLACGVRRGRRVVLLVGALSIAASFALSGHDRTAAGAWLTLPVITAHAACAAFWVGALWPLLLGVRLLSAAEAAAFLADFSRHALAAVGVLIAAGAVLAILQLSSLADLWSTPYGIRLGLKLLAVGALLALGAVNRLVLTPALARARPVAATWHRRTLGVDLALAAAIVGLTAALSLDPPPRVATAQAREHDAARADFAVHMSAQGGTLLAVVAPAVAGANRIALYPLGATGRPLAPRASNCGSRCLNAASPPCAAARSRRARDGSSCRRSCCRSPAAGSCGPIC